MPWNNQGGDSGGPWGQGGGKGSGGNGGSPWGQGGGGQQPQDLDQVLRQGRDALKRVMPGGGKGGGGKSLLLLLIIFMGIWAATGFYRVNPQQQGVVPLW